MRSLISTTAAALLALAAAPAFAAPEVQATVETEPVPSSGDAADDTCVWVHPDDPGASTIIGTDKQGGLAIYDLAGTELDYLADGDMNNVDIRYRVPLGGEEVDLVVAGNRSDDSIAVYKVAAETRGLVDVAAGTLPADLTVYGSCLYRSPVTAELYVFVNDKDGQVKQLRLFDDGAGAIDAEEVRSFDVGDQVEGCVADDEAAAFYVGEEAVGIWRYDAEPGSGSGRTLVDETGADGHLVADVEGLTIYPTAGGGGYLIASSQGDSTYAIYERGGGHAYLGSFEIAAGDAIDGVEGTDGIDVSNVALGPSFPGGVFIAQDTTNGDLDQNYKLVPWEAIAATADPPLQVDTSFDPTGRSATSDGDDAGPGGDDAGPDGDDAGPGDDAGADDDGETEDDARPAGDSGCAFGSAGGTGGGLFFAAALAALLWKRRSPPRRGHRALRRRP